MSFFAGSKIKAVLMGLGVGLLYMMVAAVSGWAKADANSLVIGQESWWGDIVGLGLVTAISEEMVFSGYIFMNVWRLLRKLWLAMLVTALMAALIHVPIAVFVLNYSMVQLAGYLLLVVLVSIGNTWVMSKSKNVLAPIMSHWLWGVAVYAFR